MNHLIQAPNLRVIDEQGNQLGVLSRGDALRAAELAGLDLVEISPEADPPVVKIVDWGKYNYQRTKQLQKNKRNTKTLDLKQIRFGLKISDHDIDVKLKKVLQFIDEGHKVKITMFYRGREMAHKDIGFALAKKVTEQLGERIIVDAPPQLLGKQLNFVIRGSAAKPPQNKSVQTEKTA